MEMSRASHAVIVPVQDVLRREFLGPPAPRAVQAGCRDFFLAAGLSALLSAQAAQGLRVFVHLI